MVTRSPDVLGCKLIDEGIGTGHLYRLLSLFIQDCTLLLNALSAVQRTVHQRA